MDGGANAETVGTVLLTTLVNGGLAAVFVGLRSLWKERNEMSNQNRDRQITEHKDLLARLEKQLDAEARHRGTLETKIDRLKEELGHCRQEHAQREANETMYRERIEILEEALRENKIKFRAWRGPPVAQSGSAEHHPLPPTIPSPEVDS